jgi:hypothetical protein
MLNTTTTHLALPLSVPSRSTFMPHLVALIPMHPTTPHNRLVAELAFWTTCTLRTKHCSSDMLDGGDCDDEARPTATPKTSHLTPPHLTTLHPTSPHPTPHLPPHTLLFPYPSPPFLSTPDPTPPYPTPQPLSLPTPPHPTTRHLTSLTNYPTTPPDPTRPHPMSSQPTV